ncbi:MAG: hypothetical protein U0235_24720 [Polyangiaceae bacterium]
MMNKKVASLAAALVLAASAVGFSLRGAHTEGSSSAAAASSVGAGGSDSRSALGPSAAVGARDLHAGASFTYELTSTRNTGDGKGAVLQSTTIGGRLVMTVVGQTAGSAAIRAELLGATRTDAPATEEKAKDLEGAFFFVMNEGGVIESFGFPRAMRGDARRQLRALVSALQVAPASGERVESDMSGEFLASYARSADGASVTKTKVRYDRVRTPAGLVSPAQIGGNYTVQATTTFTLDASGWPAAAEEAEAIKAAFQAGSMASTAKTTAKLLKKGEDKSLVGSYETAAPGFDPDVDALGESAALAKKNADTSLVAGASLGALVGDYAGAKETKVQNRAVARMGALFRLSPEAVTEARATLLKKETPRGTARAIAGALGNRGTPEAQRARRRAPLERDDHGREDHGRHVARPREGPAEGTKQALSEAAGSKDAALSSTANLALGNLAKTAGESAADVVDDLVAKLEASQTASERAHFLDALGNTGSPRAKAPILAHVHDAESLVRGAALAALRFQSGEDVVVALGGGLLAPEMPVRRATLSAIGQQTIDPYVPVFADYVKHESEVELRIFAVRVLARSVNANTEVESVLSSIATQDADPKVREAAESALAKPKH